MFRFLEASKGITTGAWRLTTSDSDMAGWVLAVGFKLPGNGHHQPIVLRVSCSTAAADKT
jgi:hypothetical protein